jgi:hypothetical protein
MLANKRVNRGPLWRHAELQDVRSSPGVVIGVINEELKVHVALMVALDVNMDFRAEKLKG